MIRYVTGDMFQSDADCLINTVNCEGFMGKGIAYQFKLKYPENNKSYIKACKTGELHIGSIHCFVENGVTIINFPTKNKWREKSKVEYIEVGLEELVKILPKLNVNKIAMPPLGCGNGGLAWTEVKGIIEDKLITIKKNYDFNVFEPSKSYDQIATIAPSLSISSLVLMQIKMKSTKISKLRLQKTAYLMDIFLKEHYFKFEKYKLGPYAYSIDIVSRNILDFQNYYEVKDTAKTYDMAYQTICSEKTTQILERLSPAIEKATSIANLIPSDEDLEGVATVIYLIENSSRISKEEIINGFKNWSTDKSERFSEGKIVQYIDFLEERNMIIKNIIGTYQLSEYMEI